MNVKTVLAVALVCGGVAFLGGCASMSSKGDSSALTSGLSDNIDLAYMAAVNQQADINGVKVIWINPPEKPRHN
ncbi:MAG TPA: hypothetical protein VK660_01890 [Xanthomonadaceae bacterium]|jgi:hypothetical protein|nr:hypothetical protein [Xanthomonadaceae bacterium]